MAHSQRQKANVNANATSILLSTKWVQNKLAQHEILYEPMKAMLLSLYVRSM